MWLTNSWAKKKQKKKANFQIAIIFVCLFLWRIQFRFFEWIQIEKIHWKNWLKWNEIINFEQNQEVILFKLKASHQESSKSNKRDRNGFYRHKISINEKYRCYDEYCQISKFPTSKSKHDTPVIHLSQNFPLDPSSLMSYTAYYEHSVAVTCSGFLIRVGYNNDGQISNLLSKTGNCFCSCYLC